MHPQAAVALTPLQALRHTVDEAREPEGGTAQRGRVLLQQLSTFADGRYDYCSFGPMPDKVVVGGSRAGSLTGESVLILM